MPFRPVLRDLHGAQDLEPRAYATAPVGARFLFGGFGDTFPMSQQRSTMTSDDAPSGTFFDSAYRMTAPWVEEFRR